MCSLNHLPKYLKSTDGYIIIYDHKATQLRSTSVANKGKVNLFGPDQFSKKRETLKSMCDKKVQTTDLPTKMKEISLLSKKRGGENGVGRRQASIFPRCEKRLETKEEDDEGPVMREESPDRSSNSPRCD